ncbi:MAG: hypothetical protein M5U09_26470 [Gammaproteobacteria bacterium]|nr:hypothetical protein [Gammaproteobacteria bacterium]
MIDPTTVTIRNVDGGEHINIDGDGDVASPFQPGADYDDFDDSMPTVDIGLLLEAMNNGSTVWVVTECVNEKFCADVSYGGHIILQDPINYDGYAGTLVLNAADNIYLDADIFDGNAATEDFFNLHVITGAYGGTYIHSVEVNVHDFTADSDVVLTGGETVGRLAISGSGEFNRDVELNSDAEILLRDGASASFNDTFHWYGGTLAEYDGGETFYIAEGAVATFGGGESSYLWLDGAHLVNRGTVNWQSGNIRTVLYDPSLIENEGVWNKNTGSLVEVSLDTEFINRGEFNINAGGVHFEWDTFSQTDGSLNFFDGSEIKVDDGDGTLFFTGGAVTGNGWINANVCAGVGGEGCITEGPGQPGVTIAPGHSLGTLNIEGDLILSEFSRTGVRARRAAH